jgi:hypothetical protein
VALVIVLTSALAARVRRRYRSPPDIENANATVVFCGKCDIVVVGCQRSLAGGS